MKHFYQPKRKAVLYHYTSVESAKAIAQNETFRLSEYSKMNDGSEYSYAKSQFLKTYQNREVWIEEVPRFMMSIGLAQLEISTVMMIGCLTEERDDIGLWDRYACAGTGCVIGIDPIWLSEQGGVTLRRVQYSDRAFRNFVNPGLMMLQSHYESQPDDREELADLAAHFVLDLYAFKDPRFKSEKEIRVSRLTVADTEAAFGLVDPGGTRADGSHAPAVEVKQLPSRFGDKRFVDLPLSDETGVSAIKSIGFGPRIALEDEVAIKAIADATKVKTWKSDAPLRY